MDGFAAAVAVFIVVTIIVGVFAGKLVQKSGKRLIVAGKSLPLLWWEPCLLHKQLMEIQR